MLKVVVVSGETGCGKTTQVRYRSRPHPPPALQVPQFILDDAVVRGEGSKVSVVCTQVPALHLPPVSTSSQPYNRRSQAHAKLTATFALARFESVH